MGGATAPTPGAPFTQIRTVHLITGDSVRVMTRADGTMVSTVLPGSPHAGGPVASFGTAAGRYVLPRLGASARRHLDPSLFNVTALSAMHGDRVPVVVTYTRRAVLPRVAGLSLDTASAVRTPRTNLVSTPGWYSTRSAGLRFPRLSHIASIRLAGAAARPEVSGTTHTLTVHVAWGSGAPAPGTTVVIENVDDSTVYLDSMDTNSHGRVTATVPEGNYSVAAFTFSRLVIAPQVDVTANSSVDLDLADATVKPEVTLPKYQVVDSALSVDRSPVAGFDFPLTFDGPHFFMRLQPTAADLAQGALHTGVSATLAPPHKGPRRTYQRLAVTADVSPGIPDSLTYPHRRSDFARVVDHFYANGPAGPRQTMTGAGAAYADLFSGRELDTQVPGRRTVLLQAGPAYYQQTLEPQSAPGDFNDVTQLISVRRFRRAGTSHLIRFAHGPVGPGYEGSRASTWQPVWRDGNRLKASLPLFDGAGSTMFGFVDGRDGDWALRRGARVLAHGRHDVYFHVPVPRGPHTYVLQATSHPRSRLWTLSTDVRDVWTFHSREGRVLVPVLTPSYRPPSSQHGGLAPGRVRFPLRFGTLAPHQRIARASLQLSTDDGRTWHPVGLTRTSPTTFVVRYRNPAASASARFVSLRVTGRDRHGNRVTETAIRVYRLR
ncbi:MAG: hypothetical protein ACXVXG_16770 [Nocardioidaceae bacterium]